MHISKALKLNKTQPELDFVDIDLSTDTPLFLDPAAFYEGEGRFAEDCSRDISRNRSINRSIRSPKGRFGIISCRGIKDKRTLVARCADAFRSQQGVVVVLTDADLQDALLAGPLGRETRVSEIIQGQLRDLLA